MDQMNLEKRLNQYAIYLQVEKGMALSSIRTYLNAIRYFFEFCSRFEEKLFLSNQWDFEDIANREVEIFLQEHQQKNWKPNTLTTYFTGIKSLYKFLHEKNIISKNSLRHLKLQKNSNPIFLANINAEEIELLFQRPITANLVGYRNRILFELVYGLGFSCTTLSQMQSLLWRATPSPTIEIQFSKRKQTFPIGSQALSVLEQYLQKRNQINTNPSPVWIDETGKKLSSIKIAEALKEELQGTCLQDERLSIIRNISAKHFAENGADVRSLQELRNTKKLQKLEELKKEEFEELVQQYQKFHPRR